jgi:agmatinase
MDDIYHPQFVGLPARGLQEADAVILPLPFEKTVSYGAGTLGGPRAILEASRQLESFDEETLIDFAERPKLHVAEPIAAIDDVEQYLAAVSRRLADLRGKFVLSLGGEHTVTYGAVTGLAGDPAEATVVQIDAHGDLIDKLAGRRWSHGTVMRRLWERGCRLVQIGIRSMSRSEYELAVADERIVTFYAHQLAHNWKELLATLKLLRGKVYLTIDVDGLDPSIIPSTGTPQPNGLTWRQTMEIIRSLSESEHCQWIGADVVEFVPSPHPPGCDIIAARLAMKVLAYWWKRKSQSGT